jgi:hypothetical protein
MPSFKPFYGKPRAARLSLTLLLLTSCSLSYAGARTLGLVRPGTASVRVEQLEDADGQYRYVAYAVQAGAFHDGDKAFALRDSLASTFRDVYLSPLETPESVYFRVRLGPYSRREEARARARTVSRVGVPAMVVEEARP